MAAAAVPEDNSLAYVSSEPETLERYVSLEPKQNGTVLRNNTGIDELVRLLEAAQNAIRGFDMSEINARTEWIIDQLNGLQGDKKYIIYPSPDQTPLSLYFRNYNVINSHLSTIANEINHKHNNQERTINLQDLPNVIRGIQGLVQEQDELLYIPFKFIVLPDPNPAGWQNIKETPEATADARNTKLHSKKGITNENIKNPNVSDTEIINAYLEECTTHQTEYINKHNEISVLFEHLKILISVIQPILDLIRRLSQVKTIQKRRRVGAVPKVKLPKDLLIQLGKLQEDQREILDKSSKIIRSAEEASNIATLTTQRSMRGGFLQLGGANGAAAADVAPAPIAQQQNKIILTENSITVPAVLTENLTPGDIIKIIIQGQPELSIQIMEATRNSNKFSIKILSGDTATAITAFNELQTYQQQLAAMNMMRLGIDSENFLAVAGHLEEMMQNTFIEYDRQLGSMSQVQINQVIPATNDKNDPIPFDEAHQPEIQSILYNCYDLQILYLIKHVEVVNLFKFILFHYDILLNNLAILINLLKLFDVLEINIQIILSSVKAKKVIENMKELLESQRQVMSTVAPVQAAAPAQAGGAAAAARPEIISQFPETMKNAEELQGYIEQIRQASNDPNLNYKDEKLSSLEKEIADAYIKASNDLRGEQKDKLYKAYKAIRILRLKKLEQVSAAWATDKLKEKAKKEIAALIKPESDDLFSAIGRIQTQDDILEGVYNEYAPKQLKQSPFTRAPIEGQTSDLQPILDNYYKLRSAQVCKIGDPNSCSVNSEDIEAAKKLITTVLEILKIGITEELLNSLQQRTTLKLFQLADHLYDTYNKESNAVNYYNTIIEWLHANGYGDLADAAKRARLAEEAERVRREEEVKRVRREEEEQARLEAAEAERARRNATPKDLKLELLELCNALITPLHFCWSKIKQQDTTDKQLDESYKEKFVALISALNNLRILKQELTKDELVKCFYDAWILKTEIDKTADETLKNNNNEEFNNLKNKIKQFNPFKTKLSSTEKINFIASKLSLIFQYLLGAALVLFRIKPKKTLSAALSVKDIEDYNPKEQNLQMKIKEFGIEDYIKLRQDTQHGGYKYEDILSVAEQNNELFIKVGNKCGSGLDGKSWGKVKDKLYGPFTNVFTPEYNNFDIYARLFGTNSLNSENPDNPDNILKIPNPKKLEPPLKYGDLTATNVPQQVMQTLSNGGNLVLFGFGFSGSGKTYTLIDGLRPPNMSDIKDGDKYDPSLLELFIKQNASSITSVEFLEIYPKGTLDGKRIFCGNDYTGLFSKDTDIQKNVKFNNITTDITFDNIFAKIKLLETYRRQNLRICATPNNPDSSRSFLQVTLNLSSSDKKPRKLVFFDMPGTENTVRIKSEFLGIESFKKVQELEKSQTDLQDYKLETGPGKTLSASFLKLFNIKCRKSQSQSQNPEIVYFETNLGTQEQINEYYTAADTEQNKLFVPSVYVFKNLLIQLAQLQNLLGINYENQYEKIASVMENLLLFFNRRPETTLKEFLKNSIGSGDRIKLYVLSTDAKKEIILQFLQKILTNDYFVLKDKLEVADINGMQIIDEDHANLEEIFGVKWEHWQNTSTPYCVNATANPSKKTDKTFDLFALFALFDKTKYNLDNIRSIVGNREKPPEKFLVFKDNKTHPMIKYFILILTIILRNLTDARTEDEIYGAIIFVIFKYVNFLVLQGADIVTTLEHLKFFFLSNTDNIGKYSNDDTSRGYGIQVQAHSENGAAAAKSGNTDEIRKKLQQTFLDNKNPKKYFKDFDLGDGIVLKERVIMGNMKQFKLLQVLQDLSGQPTTLENLGIKHYLHHKSQPCYYYDLFSTNEQQADKIVKKNALFIMFANIKIFRDDYNDESNLDDENGKSTLKLLCSAEFDTLEFAQDISSTTLHYQSVKVGGNINKFNMKQLTLHNKKYNKRYYKRSIINNKNNDRLMKTKNKSIFKYKTKKFTIN